LQTSLPVIIAVSGHESDLYNAEYNNSNCDKSLYGIWITTVGWG